MEQHTFKIVNNCMNTTNIYSYLEAFGGQSYNPYLKLFIFSTLGLIRHLWQLKTVVSNMHCSIEGWPMLLLEKPSNLDQISEYPLTKSKSHESELGNRLHPVNIPTQPPTPSSETSSTAKPPPTEDGTGRIRYIFRRYFNRLPVACTTNIKLS
jgi:hypothetical protein